MRSILDVQADSRHLIDMCTLIIDKIVAILGDIIGFRLGIHRSQVE